jgi:hypothetical protein
MTHAQMKKIKELTDQGYETVAVAKDGGADLIYWADTPIGGAIMMRSPDNVLYIVTPEGQLEREANPEERKAEAPLNAGQDKINPKPVTAAQAEFITKLSDFGYKVIESNTGRGQHEIIRLSAPTGEENDVLLYPEGGIFNLTGDQLLVRDLNLEQNKRIRELKDQGHKIIDLGIDRTDEAIPMNMGDGPVGLNYLVTKQGETTDLEGNPIDLGLRRVFVQGDRVSAEHVFNPQQLDRLHQIGQMSNERKQEIFEIALSYLYSNLEDVNLAISEEDLEGRTIQPLGEEEVALLREMLPPADPITEHVSQLTDYEVFNYFSVDEIGERPVNLRTDDEIKQIRFNLIDQLNSGAKQIKPPEPAPQITPADYDGRKCPVCMSINIDERGGREITVQPHFESPIVCDDCGATWTEESTVTGYNNLKIRRN